MERKIRQITVRVSSELHLRARLKSVRVGKPISEVIREALERWVEETPDDQMEETWA